MFYKVKPGSKFNIKLFRNHNLISFFPKAVENKMSSWVDTWLDSSLIHQTELRWIWHLFWKITKAFGAIASSSVAFHKVLEHLKLAKKWKKESESGGNIAPTFTLKHTKFHYWEKQCLDPPVLFFPPLLLHVIICWTGPMKYCNPLEGPPPLPRLHISWITPKILVTWYDRTGSNRLLLKRR